MLGMLGCAGILALLAFLLGLPVSFFFTVEHWSERLLIACMPAAFTFIAAMLLCLRDQSSHNEDMTSVRRSLLERVETSDDDFGDSPSKLNEQLLFQEQKEGNRFEHQAKRMNIIPASIFSQNCADQILIIEHGTFLTFFGIRPRKVCFSKPNVFFAEWTNWRRQFAKSVIRKCHVKSVAVAVTQLSSAFVRVQYSIGQQLFSLL